MRSFLAFSFPHRCPALQGRRPAESKSAAPPFRDVFLVDPHALRLMCIWRLVPLRHLIKSKALNSMHLPLSPWLRIAPDVSSSSRTPLKLFSPWLPGSANKVLKLEGKHLGRHRRHPTTPNLLRPLPTLCSLMGPAHKCPQGPSPLCFPAPH